MRKKNHTMWKWILVIFVLAAVVTVMVCAIKNRFIKEPEGKFIAREDAYLLYTYLYSDLAQGDLEKAGKDILEGVISQNDISGESEEESYLTLGEVKTMFTLLKERYPIYEGEISYIEEQAFSDNHRDNSALLANDFFDCYEQLWDVVHTDMPLYEEQGIFLGDAPRIKNLDDSSVSENDILLVQKDESQQASGVKLYKRTKGLSEYQNIDEGGFYREHVYLGTKGYLLLDITGYQELTGNQDFQLQTCWISSNQPEALWVTFEDYQVCIKSGQSGVLLEDGSVYDAFEDIADLYFTDGSLSYISTYDEKISGKLLSVSEDKIELEGVGFYSYREGLPVYKLYGQREHYTKSDLKIGYDFTDFVLDKDGVIVAGLVTREEKMDSIRVVVKTTGFSSAYHESISFTCDSNFLINDEHHLAGEEILINGDDARFENGRIYIRPETNLARTTITSIERDQGVPSYRGNFEIAKATDGLLLINELLLEEYLYSVVPSEMPASYPMEALKAQAVSARTYAYERMLHSGLKEYGAHVDDSAAFQVYNNIKESENTTLAIRETQGQIAAIGDDLAETYYYSTSCGFGTDIGAWHSSSEDRYGYLVSKHIGVSDPESEAAIGDITDETAFRNYISAINEKDYECGEGWYRWSYHTTLNIDRLNENLIKRYEASEKSILPGKPPVFTQIVRMQVVKRGNGGVIDELLIEGKEGYVKVVGEHAVRSVLANDSDKVVRQGGSESTVSTLLPSAFAVLDVEVDSDTNAIVSYTVTGGGYGHGIGMSQNGAKSMALAGMNCGEILQFFYEGVNLRDMYELK